MISTPRVSFRSRHVHVLSVLCSFHNMCVLNVSSHSSFVVWTGGRMCVRGCVWGGMRWVMWLWRVCVYGWGVSGCGGGRGVGVDVVGRWVNESACHMCARFYNLVIRDNHTLVTIRIGTWHCSVYLYGVGTICDDGDMSDPLSGVCWTSHCMHIWTFTWSDPYVFGTDMYFLACVVCTPSMPTPLYI